MNFAFTFLAFQEQEAGKEEHTFVLFFPVVVLLHPILVLLLKLAFLVVDRQQLLTLSGRRLIGNSYKIE